MPVEQPAELDLEPFEVRLLICNRAYSVNQLAVQKDGTKARMLALAERCVELIRSLPDDPPEPKK